MQSSLERATRSNMFSSLIATISLMIDMASGETVATAAVGREGAIGLLSVLGPSPSAATAIVRAAGTASRIPSPQFHAAFNRSPAIRHAVQIHVRAILMKFQLGAACNAGNGRSRGDD